MKKIAIQLVLMMLCVSLSAQTTYFVSNSGNDSNDGLSWTTAKATIDGAMALITSPNDDSVFVATGTYPACTIKNGTHVYGGFAGTENHLYERQPLTYGIAADSSCTIIDAQHDNNYAVQINSYFHYNGSYHCRENTFDGFYVTGGNQYGIRDVANNTHTISNCTMTGNACGLYLGMSYSNSYYNATFQVSDCKIYGNTLSGGVRMYSGSQSYGATYEFNNCEITGNTGSQCGGIWFDANYTTPYNTVVVKNCDITKNTASGLDAKAGGLLTQANDFLYTPTRNEWQIINSRIIDNTVYTTATIASTSGSRPYIAGGVSVFTHPAHIIGCVIANNSAISTEGIDVTGGVVTYSYATSSGGPSSGNPVGRMYMANCVVANNLAQTSHADGTGGIRTTSAATVKNTVIYSNKRNSEFSQLSYSANHTFPYSYCAANHIDAANDFSADSTNFVLDTATLPQFVSPSSMVGASSIATDLSNLNADWHVMPNSPLIDAGDPNTAFITYLPATDMDGNPRIGNNRADIGAYELSNTTFNQSITWNQDLTADLSDGTLTLNATATSGLPVTYTCNNEDIATVNGNVLTFHGAGYAIVTASQPGNATWNAAADVSKILTVTSSTSDLQPQSILWNQELTFPLSDEPVVLAAAATSGLPVQFTSSDESVATVNGSILTMHSVGLAIITASQPGNDEYAPAQNVMKILNVTEPVEVETYDALQVTVSPNPSNSIFKVDGAMENGDFHVCDMYGKDVMSGRLDNSNAVVDMSAFPAGMYFLRLRFSDGQTVTVKLMKAE